MPEPSTGDRLILWDPDLVFDWMVRNETYARLRGRANAGTPALSVLAYADVLRTLRLRRLTEAQIKGLILELRDQFLILDLTADRAESFAEAALDLARREEPSAVEHEAWFVWQVALARREDHRVMTKAPQRYLGLLRKDQMA